MKPLLIAVAAIAVVSVIVIPVALTQHNKNDSSESRLGSDTDTFPVGGNETETASPTPSLRTPTVAPTPSTSVGEGGGGGETSTVAPTPPPSVGDGGPDGTASPWTPPTEPLLGDAAGTPYLHCPANPNLPSNEIHHIVLLHGASFNKEIWLNKGILPKFCEEPNISATALDMSSASHTQLQTVLDAVVANVNTDVELPLVLVTPSAGGTGVVDWIKNGDVNQLRDDYLSVWVPVAVGSLSSSTITDQQIESLAPLPVLAIYGDGDDTGGRLSEKLGRLVDATVVELPGGHPVYRDSPDEFAAEILDYLGVAA